MVRRSEHVSVPKPAVVQRSQPTPIPEPDMVNHPPHYADTDTDNGIECIDAIRAALGTSGFIAFLRGQVIKYQWRLGKKGDAVEDNRKAIWYAQKLDETLSGGE